MFHQDPIEPNREPIDRQSNNVEDPLTIARDTWVLKTWAEGGDTLLHSLRNLLISGSRTTGFQNAQRVERVRLEKVRKELFPLIQSGYELYYAISSRDFSQLSNDERRGYISALGNLQKSFLPIIDELTEINSLIVKEWWSDRETYGGTGNIILRSKKGEHADPFEDVSTELDWLNAMRSARNFIVESFEFLNQSKGRKEEVVDIVRAAQRIIPKKAIWEQDPSELHLNATCSKPEIHCLLKEIVDQLEESFTRLSHQGLREMFRIADEEEEEAGFSDMVSSRLQQLSVHQSQMYVSVPDEQTLCISVAISTETRDDWTDEISNLRGRLKGAQDLAKANGLTLEINLLEDPLHMQLILKLNSLDLAESFLWSEDRYGNVREVGNALTDTVQFRFSIPSRDSELASSLHVQTQLTPLMTWSAFKVFKGTLESVAEFIAESPKSWTSLRCEANCSITLNKDSYSQGFFETTLREYEPQQKRMTDSWLKDLYTFSWEEIKKSELEFYEKWNKPWVSLESKIVVPANLFHDEVSVSLLNQLCEKFRVIVFDCGVKSSIAELFSPHDRVEVLRSFLEAITTQCLNSHSDDSVLWCRGVGRAIRFETGDDDSLFTVEVYDTKRDLVSCGGFAASTFELKMRSHCLTDENSVLERLQDGISAYSPGESVQDILEEQSLFLSPLACTRITKVIEKRFSGSIIAVASDPIQAMIEICRDPWNVIEVTSSGITIRDMSHPPAPSTDVVYGVDRAFGMSDPILLFRRALRLYEIQLEGKNNGYDFHPSEEFYDKLHDWSGLPLRVE